jgi:uncharacterized protein YbjQ (UPF0145 family)
LDESEKKAENDLSKMAEKLNANAVLGVNFSCSDNAGAVFLMGTAAVLEEKV